MNSPYVFGAMFDLRSVYDSEERHDALYQLYGVDVGGLGERSGVTCSMYFMLWIWTGSKHMYDGKCFGKVGGLFSCRDMCLSVL